jgi:phosphate transporter
MRSRREHL